MMDLDMLVRGNLDELFHLRLDLRTQNHPRVHQVIGEPYLDTLQHQCFNKKQFKHS